jgi:hypothetical protein
MRAIYLSALIAGLAYPDVVFVQGPSSFGQAERAAIEQLLDGYGQAFSDEDYTKLREYIQAPFVRFGPSNTLSEPERVERVLDRFSGQPSATSWPCAG